VTEPFDLRLLDGCQDQRQQSFHVKTDLPLPDAALRASGIAIDETQLQHDCGRVLGGPVTIAPLGTAGTFHRLWRIAGRPLLCRAGTLAAGCHDGAMLLDRAIHERLPAITPGISAIRFGQPDFMIVSEAAGQPMLNFDDDDARMLPLLEAQGRALARVHRIRVDGGFGLLDVRQAADGKLVGSQATWDAYLRLRLGDHVNACREMEAITIEEATTIRRLFREMLPAVREPVLLHGDPGSHNVFVEQDDVTALIDWEDALAGDPIFDVAFWATFHPVRRHQTMLNAYRREANLPGDFARRFWLYFLRIALAKTVLRQRLGLVDRTGRQPASLRIQLALRHLATHGERMAA